MPKASYASPKQSWWDSTKTFVGAFAAELVPAYSKNLDNIQTTLDIGGFTPIIGAVPDAANTLISAGRGKWSEAVINGIAIVPFFGDGVKGASMVAKYGDEAVAAAGLLTKHVDDVAPVVVKHADEATTGAIKVVNSKSLKERMIESGKLPPAGMKNPQAHHDLPVKHKDKFEQAGFDINDPQYGRWVSGGPEGNHQKWSHAFNQEWMQFFRDNPGAKQDTILPKMYELRDKYQ